MSDTPSKPITLSTATNSSDADPAVAEASKVTPVKVTPVKLTPAKPAAATNNAAAKSPGPYQLPANLRLRLTTTAQLRSAHQCCWSMDWPLWLRLHLR